MPVPMPLPLPSAPKARCHAGSGRRRASSLACQNVSDSGPTHYTTKEIANNFVIRRAGTGAAISQAVRKIWISLVVGFLSLSGVAVAADAFVVTEREELERFVSDVTGARADTRVDGALSYTNPSEVPCRLTVDGKPEVYGEGEGTELAEALRSALRVFDSDRQNLLQHSVRVDGERATVTARVGDESYEQTVIYELTREHGRWLVRSIRVL